MASVPATAAGLDRRIGILREGTDADVVLWDSYPLQLGATLTKVWIDGVIQIPVPPKTGEKHGDVTVGKGKEGRQWREVLDILGWGEERKRAIDGLPTLENRKE